ncbi:hypothetical protein BH11ARM1_BH11ARM1_00240 [soil metagenome]
MDGKTIIKASKDGDLATVQACLAADPSLINALDKDGSTPLHCAAWKGHPEIVTALLDAGADINAKNENSHWGDTPLHAAAHGNRKNTAIVLLERGADRNGLNTHGRTPLQETALHNATPVAKLLRIE